MLGLLLCGPGAVQAAGEAPNPCGSLRNGYGPYDYRKDRDKLEIVDAFHFSPMVESLIKPMGQHFGGDFDYTLRASPNHHRALIALARYSERVKLQHLPSAKYTVECYFDRAIRFAPDDPVVRMIFAGHLGRTNRAAEAIPQLDYVVKNAGDNPFTHYNAGLAYFEIKEYQKALTQAHEALRLGLPRNELRDNLKQVGQWKEPADVPKDPAKDTPAAEPAQAAVAASAPASSP